MLHAILASIRLLASLYALNVPMEHFLRCLVPLFVRLVQLVHLAMSLGPYQHMTAACFANPVNSLILFTNLILLLEFGVWLGHHHVPLVHRAITVWAVGAK